MNIVITVNLNGNAFQLEKNGYDALREYLEDAARRLEGNPDRDEIIADIEQAIADKFRAVLGANKTVVVAKEVDEIIAEMGPVQDATTETDGAPRAAAPGDAAAGAAGGTAADTDGTTGATGTAKRLYKINEGAMIAGVCNGLAAYFNIDATIFRLLFVILTVFTWGIGILLYIVMAIVIPSAHTPAEKAAAFGTPSTAEEFIRRAKKGYYEGFKTFRDKRAHREWKRKFKQEMRGWSHNLRREMQANAFQWQQNWQQHWAPRPPPLPGAWFAVPVLTLVSVAISLLGLFAVISLVATGAFFGVALPAGMPLWVGVILLLVVCSLAIWPVKMLRHSFCYHGPYGYPGPFMGLLNSFVGLGIFVFLVWLANRHIPEVHAFLEQLRPHLHHAVDAVRQWWNGS
jgi:phage shock protein PspC (stress-responsive transcriptional regulator)